MGGCTDKLVRAVLSLAANEATTIFIGERVCMRGLRGCYHHSPSSGGWGECVGGRGKDGAVGLL